MRRDHPQAIRLERSVIRRRIDNPAIAEGEQIRLEFDPEQVRRLFRAGGALARAIRPLLR